MKAIISLGLVLFLLLSACHPPGSPTAPETPSGPVLVAVGAGGLIARSLDLGKTWSLVMANPNLPSSRIIHGNVVFADNVQVLGNFQQGPQNQQSVNSSTAAGQIGSVTNPFFGDMFVRGTLYQQLGQNWVGPITNPFGGSDLYSVAFGNLVFVAGGNGGKIARSTDFGVTWGGLIVNPFAGLVVSSICYGNGVFVAVGGGGQIARSTDYGVTWGALIVNAFGGLIVNVVFTNGVFIALSGTALIGRSLDLGVTWQDYTAAGSVGWALASGNGVVLSSAGASDSVAASYDNGKTWAVISSAFGATQLTTLVFGNGIFVAGSFAGDIAYSKDNGKTWTSVTSPFGGTTIWNISYNFGIFQAGGAGGKVARSFDNGKTWGSLITNPFGTNVIENIASSPVNMVCVSRGGFIATAGWNAAMSKNIMQPYTPVFTGFGAVINVVFNFVMRGNMCKVIGTFKTGVPNAVGASIGLPFGMIADSFFSGYPCGNFVPNAVSASAEYCLALPGQAYVGVGVQSAGLGGMNTVNGNVAAGNGWVIGVDFEVPIAGFNT